MLIRAICGKIKNTKVTKNDRKFNEKIQNFCFFDEKYITFTPFRFDIQRKITTFANNEKYLLLFSKKTTNYETTNICSY